MISTILSAARKGKPQQVYGDFVWDKDNNAVFKENPEGKYLLRKKYKDGTVMVKQRS